MVAASRQHAVRHAATLMANLSPPITPVLRSTTSNLCLRLPVAGSPLHPGCTGGCPGVWELMITDGRASWGIGVNEGLD